MIRHLRIIIRISRGLPIVFYSSFSFVSSFSLSLYPRASSKFFNAPNFFLEGIRAAAALASARECTMIRLASELRASRATTIARRFRSELRPVIDFCERGTISRAERGCVAF